VYAVGTLCLGRGVASPRAPGSRRGAGAARATGLRVPKARPPPAAAPLRLNSAERPSKPHACARLSVVELHPDVPGAKATSTMTLLSLLSARHLQRRALRAARAWESQVARSDSAPLSN
jgi:hypothetical protein